MFATRSWSALGVMPVGCCCGVGEVMDGWAGGMVEVEGSGSFSAGGSWMEVVPCFGVALGVSSMCVGEAFAAAAAAVVVSQRSKSLFDTPPWVVVTRVCWDSSALEELCESESSAAQGSFLSARVGAALMWISVLWRRVDLSVSSGGRRLAWSRVGAGGVSEPFTSSAADSEEEAPKETGCVVVGEDTISPHSSSSSSSSAAVSGTTGCVCVSGDGGCRILGMDSGGRGNCNDAGRSNGCFGSGGGPLSGFCSSM